MPRNRRPGKAVAQRESGYLQGSLRGLLRRAAASIRALPRNSVGSRVFLWQGPLLPGELWPFGVYWSLVLAAGCCVFPFTVVVSLCPVIASSVHSLPTRQFALICVYAQFSRDHGTLLGGRRRAPQSHTDSLAQSLPGLCPPFSLRCCGGLGAANGGRSCSP